MPVVWTTGITDLDELSNVAITSAASLQILQYNSSGQLVNRPVEGTEANTTPVAGGNDTVIGSGVRVYTFFTLPSTAAFFRITGIEVKNGTVVNGNWAAAIEAVDANPPTLNPTTLQCWTQQNTQTGVSSVQRASMMGGMTIQPAGRLLAAFFYGNSATGRYGTTTVASANNAKTVAYTQDFPMGNVTAWTATTEEPYIKVYYKPVLGI